MDLNVALMYDWFCVRCKAEGLVAWGKFFINMSREKTSYHWNYALVDLHLSSTRARFLYNYSRVRGYQ